MVKKFILILGIVSTSAGLYAQEIVTRGAFSHDTVKIGVETYFSLSVKYPRDWQVVMPDSTFDFSPFEFYSKSFAPTKSDSVFAYDSVAYHLATFEVDPVLQLQLPVFIVKGADSIEIMSNVDSVYVHQMIAQLPDSIQFRENLAFVPTEYAFNYPYFTIGATVLLLVVALIFVFFGKTIRAKIKAYRMKKDFEKFTIRLEQGISSIRQNENNKPLIEDILVVWKKYMEKLEDRPFTKYTSKEVIKAGYGSELKDILQNIDRAIYGNINDEQMHKNFESLEDYTAERYTMKLKEVQNG